MKSAEVWNFLRVMGVPTNELHQCGYISIGCEPCTRPVLPNQHEREGRWWWEDAKAKECGLHSGNIKKDETGEGKGNGAEETRDLFQSPAVTALDKSRAEKLAKVGALVDCTAARGWVNSKAGPARLRVRSGVDPRPASRCPQGEGRDKDTLLVVYAPWCQWSQVRLTASTNATGRTGRSLASTFGRVLKAVVYPIMPPLSCACAGHGGVVQPTGGEPQGLVGDGGQVPGRQRPRLRGLAAADQDVPDDRHAAAELGPRGQVPDGAPRRGHDGDVGAGHGL